MIEDINKIKKEKILMLGQFLNSKFENIKWVLGGLVAQSILINRPDIVEAAKLPIEAHVDDLRFPTTDLFGLVLSPKDRQIVSGELLAAARRLLIADSTDQLIESICRAWGVHIDSSARDPYDKDENVNFNGSKLYSAHGAGSLLKKEERLFVEKVAWPIRNAISHNNGIIPKGKRILQYSGKIGGQEISVELAGGAPLKLTLEKCHTYFKIIRIIGDSGMRKLLSGYEK